MSQECVNCGHSTHDGNFCVGSTDEGDSCACSWPDPDNFVTPWPYECYNCLDGILVKACHQPK
jgi:hypothetical protein